MAQYSVRFDVSGQSEAEANRLTSELEQYLRNTVDNLELSRVRDDAAHLDMGTTLIAATATVLASPAAVAFAKELGKGVADWLRKRRANISITPAGGIKVENVRPEDVEHLILQALADRKAGD